MLRWRYMTEVNVVGEAVQVQKGSVPQHKQILALLRKNVKVHTRINACPCFNCCGPGQAIPVTIFNACTLHFCSPIFFVLIITFVPWIVVKLTMDNPDSFLEVATEMGTTPKAWYGIPTATLGADAAPPGTNYQLGYDSFQYGPSGEMLIPAVHHLFKPEHRRDYSWEDGECVAFPVTCYCQTLALVGPDAAVDAFKAFMTAEFQAYNSTMRPSAPDFAEARTRTTATLMGMLDNFGARRLTGAAARTIDMLPEWLTERLFSTAEERRERRERRLTDKDNENCTEQEGRGGRTGCDCPLPESSWCDVNPGHNGPIFRKFASAEEVDRWIDDDQYGYYVRDRSETSDMDRLCGAIIFENDVLSASEPSFTLRFNVTDEEMDVSSDLTSAEVLMDSGEFLKLRWYYQSGFLGLQHAVQKFLGQERGNNAGDAAMLNRDPQFFKAPTSPSETWEFGGLAGEFLGNPFIMSLMFGPIASSMAFYISRERQSRQRELMRMMGLSDSALMWSWVILFVVLNFFISFIMCILFMSFLLRRTNFFFFWMTLWWYSNVVTAFGMMIAAVISSDKMAAMAAFGALFAATWGILGVGEYDEEWRKALHCLLGPNAFLLTARAVWNWEGIGIGTSPDNVNSNFNNFNVGLGIFMLFLDFWLYLAIYFYIDNVAPWHDVGVPRKPWFCCLPSYWRELMGKAPVIGGLGDLPPTPDKVYKEDYMQSEDDEHLKEMRQNNQSVRIRELYKTFTDAAGQKVLAVNNLSLTMYQDECFCLLGHNGAGKTTTMMMLTGCLPQTAGSIQVRGCQVPEHLRMIRSDMGFCPQHNVLVDELTVFEHLVLFGMIGGMEHDAVVQRGNQLLTAVALMDKMHARSTALSGGMKRKLSCALAFLSNPYLVILDEPSSGMDPFARRGMWDTLKQWRTGHILCLTTHYMDEADALGDRVAIMSNGQLACSGSPAFLKRKFGCGYMISFAKKDQRATQDTEILHAVRGIVGTDADIMSTVGKELIIQVPFGMAAKFPDLFTALDGQLDKLGIETYGTSVTNLEEVFLKVARMDREKKKQKSKEFKDHDEEQVDALVADKTVEKKKAFNEQLQQFFIQFYALLIRRFRHGFRNRLSCCIQLGMPVGCIFIFFLIIMVTTVHALPKLVLDTANFNPQIESGPKVPITVAAVNGDTQMDSILNAWARLSGIDGLRTERVTPLAIPPGTFTVNQTQEAEIATGYLEESYFMQRVLANKDLNEATQYGSVFYPQHSSWCPSDLTATCSSAPGPTIMCNMSAPHTGPLLFGKHAAAALAQNGVVDIQVANHPFQKTKTQRGNDEFVSGIFGAIIIMAAYGFIPSGATSYVVMEKEKDVKHQLVISGCSHVAYWLSNYVFDSLWGLVPVAGAWITFAIYGIDAFATSPGINASVGLFLAFLPAMAGYAYMFSFLFNRAGVAFFVSLIFNLSFGILAMMTVFILSIFPSAYEASRAMEIIFRFIPIYPLGYGHLMVSIYWRQADDLGYGPLSGLNTGGAWCPPEEERQTPYRPERECRRMAGDEFLMLCITGVLWILMVMFLDIVLGMPTVKKAIGGVMGGPNADWCQRMKQQGVEDEFVLAEKERVNGVDKQKQFVYVNDIHKVYGRSGSHAVRGISFAADEGQVFGLLGVNGAGKTSTFKMLCGQIEPTGGEVCIQGYDVTKYANKARKFIGYCPQFDALLESLTTKEHLYLYGRMKGLYSSELTSAAMNQLENLDLLQYTNSRAGQLSGGNKRKLSVAMATIGEPPMVFLDEPSAGMDPVARRGMWSVIQTIADKRKKSVVILTTHSMEEAEALCSRIAIQVDGQFRCMGTPQQIKSKYGMGLELNIRLKTPTPKEIEDACAKLNSTPQSVVDINVARLKVQEAFGATVAQELAIRPGAPLAVTSTANTGMASLAEWSILVQNSQAFEQFLGEELGKGSGSADVLCTVLEKTQNVKRYQITPAALQGKFKSLGVLFNLFQENKDRLMIEDFQICQTSLEQIFNRFATMQQSQASAPAPQAAATPAPQAAAAGPVDGNNQTSAPAASANAAEPAQDNPTTVTASVLGKPAEPPADSNV